MRALGVLASLGLLAVSSGAGADEAGMPAEGTAVVAAPAPPATIARLNVPKLQLEPGPGVADTSADCAVDRATQYIERNPAWRGWKANDANNAVVTYVRDSPDGRVRLQRAVNKIGITCQLLEAADPEIQRIAEYSVRRRGLVQVITKPAEVSVLVGGILRGFTEVELWFSAGQHDLVLEKAGFRPQTVRVTVEPERVTRVKATMRPQ